VPPNVFHAPRESRDGNVEKVMNHTALKAFVAMIPACTLLAGSAIIWLRQKSVSAFLQFLGACGLIIVVLSHALEALRFFPWMGWGSEYSVGHYLDLLCAILGFTLFSLGYLIHAVNMRIGNRK
jgi:hypothetical protein